MPRKAQRQMLYCAKMPPIAGPSTVATPQVMAFIAMARGHKCCGKISRSMASDVATIRPAPKP